MKLFKILAIIFVLLILAVFAGLMLGAVHINFSEIFLKDNQTILEMRLVRILTAILVGGGLSVSGIALQAILRNPLAEPYLLGTSSGACLAAVIGVILGVSRFFMPIMAFVGAVLSIILVYNLARQGNRITDKSLILSGVIISVALSALIVFFVSIYVDRAVHEVTWWLWGSLQVYDYRLLPFIAVPVILGILAIYIFSQDLNAISMGEEEAMHLGIDSQKVKNIIIFVTTLIAASLTSVCGIIGFVGLIIPHIVRMIVGSNHKILIPVACLASAVFMVLCDILSRTLFAPIEIPIGVVTAVIGAPVFIILLKREKKNN